MEELTSTSSENMSMVMVTFSDGTNMDMAALDLREKIDLVKSSLPEDCTAPTVMTINPDMMPVAVYALSGRDLADLQNLAEDVFSPAIERVEGVASVDVSGGVENEISVVTYADRLAGYNLSLSYISSILAADNAMIPGRHRAKRLGGRCRCAPTRSSPPLRTSAAPSFPCPRRQRAP